MTPEGSIGEIIQRVLRETRADVSLIAMTDALDGRKYALRVQNSEGEQLLLLYKRAVTRILERRSSAERLRDLIETELLAHKRRGSGPKGNTGRT